MLVLYVRNCKIIRYFVGTSIFLSSFILVSIFNIFFFAWTNLFSSYCTHNWHIRFTPTNSRCERLITGFWFPFLARIEKLRLHLIRSIYLNIVRTNLLPYAKEAERKRRISDSFMFNEYSLSLFYLCDSPEMVCIQYFRCAENQSTDKLRR